MTQVTRQMMGSPVRPVTSLGIYSNHQLEEQVKGMSNSVKSIKQFMINGQYYANAQPGEEHSHKHRQDDVENEQSEVQFTKQVSISKIKMPMKICMEEATIKDDFCNRSDVDSLDIEYPYTQSLSPKHRQYQVVANKYKSNIQYLQTQAKQIYNMHVHNTITQEAKHIKAEISKLQTQTRKLKLEVNQFKNMKSKAQSNQAKVQELRYLITNQKKILNKLNIRELELEDYLGRDKKQYHEIYEEASLEDIEDISKVQPVESRIKRSVNEGKNLSTSKYRKQVIKLADVSECNSSYFVKMRDSAVPSATDISDIINSSAFMLKNVTYEPETSPFEKQQEWTSATLKQNKNEEEHKSILKQRVRILKQSIMSRSEDFVRRIELLKKEKVCLRKIIQIIKMNTINIEAQKRKINKIILRQKSQSIFRSRLKYGQKVTPNKSEKVSLFAFREQQSNSRENSLSNQIKYFIHEDAWKQYQISMERPAKNMGSKSEEKEKKLKQLRGMNHNKLRFLGQDSYSSKDKATDTKFYEQYYSIGLTQ